MGGMADIQLHERINIAIFHGDGFFGISGRTTDKSVVVTQVFEYYRAVRFRVKILFHNRFSRKRTAKLIIFLFPTSIFFKNR
jgi:hypothetical protein